MLNVKNYLKMWVLNKLQCVWSFRLRLLYPSPVVNFKAFIIYKSISKKKTNIITSASNNTPFTQFVKTQCP